MSKPDFGIIGAGPAGLAAGYEAVKSGGSCAVMEAEAQVGGLSKTIFHNGYGFDIGGHRFFTKLDQVNDLWHEILPDDFIRRPRLSRIYYNGKYFRYPLKLGDALFGLDVFQGIQVLASFIKARLTPNVKEVSFEDWVSNRFGRALYEIFFKTYTEKVWGTSCDKISADWAAQRIKNLNLTKAALNAFGFYRNRKTSSLIDTFDYPRLGPGQLYQEMADLIEAEGSQVLKEHNVVHIRHNGSFIEAADCETPDGPVVIEGDNFISSMPIDDLIRAMKPGAPQEVLDAANKLRYRAIITANLIIDRESICPDNWIYLHSAGIKAGRMQVYKNWSPELVPDGDKSSIGFEYFTESGDELWQLSEKKMLDFAAGEFEKLGLGKKSEVMDGCTVRYAQAYPVYDLEYKERLAVVREYLRSFENLLCIGRAGQFRYNNMDHSIYTGMLAIRKFGGERADPWDVNEDQDYLG